MIHSFLLAVAGGALIGLSASLLLLTSGRIAGISGILGGMLKGAQDRDWRLIFLFGFLIGGVALQITMPDVFAISTQRSLPIVGIAGFLVGFGVRMGNGCTSGHGVCGLTRFSKRSLVATISFMATGILTASLIQIFFGGMV